MHRELKVITLLARNFLTIRRFGMKDDFHGLEMNQNKVLL